jgi:2-keto-3-deoxy-L-rhamnonate aldolase RhmA
MKAARQLMQKVGAGQITTGVLATDLLWPQLIEFLQLAQMDYLIADQEHGTHSDDLVAAVCALGRQVDFPVLIRPIDTETSTIRRAIDRGPCGLLLPTVETVSQLDRVRDSIWMPPRGRRRPGGPGNYWVSDFGYDSWKQQVEDDFIVLPQIESRLGLEKADQIAAHEITTAIAIGPYDLSMELGVGAQLGHPTMMEAIYRIRAAGEAAGKAMWRIGDGPTMVREGFHFLCVGEPMGMLKGALVGAQQDAIAALDQKGS